VETSANTGEYALFAIRRTNLFSARGLFAMQRVDPISAKGQCAAPSHAGRNHPPTRRRLRRARERPARQGPTDSEVPCQAPAALPPSRVASLTCYDGRVRGRLDRSLPLTALPPRRGPSQDALRAWPDRIVVFYKGDRMGEATRLDMLANDRPPRPAARLITGSVPTPAFRAMPLTFS
jgi:hypothetical protein